MPTESDLREYLATVRELVNQIDDNVVDDLDIDQDEVGLMGIMCEHGANYYHVVGEIDRSLPFLSVNYPYNFVETFAQRQAVENADISAEQLQGEDDIPVDYDIQEAANQLDTFAARNPDQMRSVRNRLYDKISTTDTAYNADTTENGAILGFTISRKIFPEEGDLNPSTFNEVVQSIVSVGVRGRRSLAQSFNINVPVELETESESDENLRYIG